MLMWATKAEDLHLRRYVTEWDFELRHVAVKGSGGQISKMRLPPPSVFCTRAGHHGPTGPAVHYFGYVPAADNRPGGSVHRECPSEPSGARESGKWLVGVSRWSPHKFASDRHVPHHW